MGREERKLRKWLEERARRERRLARKHSHSFDSQQSGDESGSVRGIVAGVGPSCCEILDDGLRLLCRTSLDVAVGDEVLYSPERMKVERLLPRRTALSRPDPFNPHRERIIAANIDVVVVVASVKSPPWRPGLIDRYLIAIENSRAAPLICVNKSDLLDQSGPPLEVEIYRALSIPVLLCSAATGQGIEELAVALAGKTCVFTGHSGVGKSSLLNALAPDLDLATGAISAAHGRGRHTTTSATLHVLPNGATIIDTPGIREFGLWRVGRDDLRSYFPEMRDLAVFCEFRDCTHTHEPVCAVKEAVERGSIARARYAAYLRIWQTL